MAVARAQEEAVLLGHGEVGTEHLLLGLFVEPGSPVVAALESFDVTSEEVRAQVHRVRNRPGDAPAVELPFTPRAKRVLEHALRESLAREDDVIGPEHLLLGLLSEPESGAARILRDFDVEGDDLRQAMTDELRGGRSRPPFVKWRESPLAEGYAEAESMISARIDPIAGPSPRASATPLLVAIVLAALGFPLGLVAGFLIWG